MGKILLIQYLIWQSFDVPKKILQAWKNFLLFNLNYFSIFTLLKTFFPYWHKYHYPYGKKFDPWRYFEAFIFNMMSRVIGAMLRTCFIILGILIEIPIFLAGIIIFVGWLVLPLLLIIGFLFGIMLMV